MPAFERLKDFFNPVGDDDYEDDDMEVEAEDIESRDEKVSAFRPRLFPSNDSNRRSESSSSLRETKVLVYEPRGFEEASKIVDSLKNNKIVVINFANMKADGDRSVHQCQKEVFDFVNGAIYALEGNIKKISETIFVISPQGVDIDTNISKEVEKKGTHKWAI